ncbi:MAG: LysR family transcriptional regulator [Synergistaceae bacterium]|nr:LysR family transcriptional regulator [Synergistaceae bacterium]
MQQELEYIYEIYKSGSFSKAAENLYITQPALSMAVKKIESAIGMSLFDRATRPLQLTEAGKIYIESIEKFLALEEDMNNKIHDIRELKSGNLCIGGSHYINAYVLPEALAKYSALYPGIKIDLIEASSAVLAEMLNERIIDLTFSCNDELIAKFEHYPAFHDYILLAVSPLRLNLPCALSSEDIKNNRHLKSNCPSLPLEKLKNLEYVILSEGNNLHDRAIKIFEAAGLDNPKIKIEISQLATSYHLARVNFAATFISDRIILSQPTEHKLNFYKINLPVTKRLFFAVLPKREYTSKAVKTFIELQYLH